MALPIDALLTPMTADEAMTLELQVATSEGLVTTAWQPVSPERTILATMAVIIADFSVDVNLTARMGFASLAAQLASEVPMDLVSKEVYNVDRIPASYASCDSSGFSMTNTGGVTYGPFTPGQVIVSNPVTGKQYVNSAKVTITAGVSTPVALVSQAAGAAYTSGPGTITNLVKPLTDVICTNTASLVGADAETNAALLVRDQAKLGTLSPNGPSAAYYFVATSILDVLQPFYNAALTEPVTRVLVVSAPARTTTYLANAAGPLSAPDLAIVTAAILAWCVPLGVTATVAAAGSTVVNITDTVYVPSVAGIADITIQNAVAAALATYFEALPIGGVTDATPNVVPIGGIRGIIYGALVALSPSYSAKMSVTVTSPTVDTAVGATNVPVLGSLVTTVVQTT